jgi:hypothetical protein
MREIGDLLKEAKERVEHIKQNLPSHIDPVGLSRVKLAFAPLACREALIWRVAELTHSACTSYERDEIGTGLVLTRAVTECTAATWYVMETVRDFVPENFSTTDDIMLKLWLGSRKDSNLPDPINVLKMLDHANKTCPGIRGAYDSLSEYSHPNRAAQSLYRKINHETKIINFGNYPGDSGLMGLNCLLAALIAFEFSYNKITDFMPKFISNCEVALPEIKGQTT